MTKINPLYPCHGSEMYNDLKLRMQNAKTGSVFLTREEFLFLKKEGKMPEKFQCQWPVCDCPIESVSKVYWKEKIAFWVEEELSKRRSKDG